MTFIAESFLVIIGMLLSAGIIAGQVTLLDSVLWIIGILFVASIIGYFMMRKAKRTIKETLEKMQSDFLRDNKNGKEKEKQKTGYIG